MKKETISPTSGRRTVNAALRRTSIIDAALEEFLANGFAATRIEAVAKRAGVAKGTIYLNFQDKEALFQGIVEREIGPHIDAVKAVAASGASLRVFLDTALPPMMKDLVQTRRGELLRMFLSEAGRFPKIAESYYRLVVSPGLQAIRTLAQNSLQRGDLKSGALVEFPQLLIAPILLSVFWTGLFERFRHLEVEQMARVYFSHMAPGEINQPL